MESTLAMMVSGNFAYLIAFISDLWASSLRHDKEREKQLISFISVEVFCDKGPVGY